jgi:membrane protein DedA with SNARE-associated domain
MDALFHWITAYGPGMLFLLLMTGVVGIPIPDETLLVFCGYLVSQGKLNPAVTFFSALLGSWCGISISYTIGRTAGIGVVHRFGKYLHITDERLARVHQWFDRIGHWALFVGYYIAGVRHFTAIVAGTSGLSFPGFAKFAWPGGLLWVSTFLALGYYIGEDWERIAEKVHQYLLYGSIVLLAGVLGYYLWRRSSAPGGER